MNDTQLKNAAGDSKALFLTPETYELIRTAARGTIVPDETQFTMEKRGNQTFFSLVNVATIGPFHISLAKYDTGWNFQVGTGSITDGTNGDAIDLSSYFDIDVFITETCYIVVEAAVDSSLATSGWTITTKETAPEAEEVGFTSGDQSELRLLLGKITIVESVGTVSQAIFNSARITHGFVNGVLVKVFELAPTNAADL